MKYLAVPATKKWEYYGGITTRKSVKVTQLFYHHRNRKLINRRTRVLIFGALGLAMISITTAILTAAGKPDWTFILTAPLLPLAIVGYWFLIPRLGAIGASIAFAAFASLGALVTVLAVYRLLQVLPPITTFCRSILVSGLADVLASIFTVESAWLVAKLVAIALVILLALLLSGEFSKSEIISILGRMRLPISPHLNK